MSNVMLPFFICNECGSCGGGMERGGWSPAITGDSNTWKVQLLQWKEAIPQLKKRETLLLIHFLFANAKLAIWKSRKNQLAGGGWTDAVLCLRGLVAACLRVKHAYYTLINHLQGFLDVWAVGQVLCSLGENDSLILKF